MDSVLSHCLQSRRGFLLQEYSEISQCRLVCLHTPSQYMSSTLLDQISTFPLIIYGRRQIVTRSWDYQTWLLDKWKLTSWFTEDVLLDWLLVIDRLQSKPWLLATLNATWQTGCVHDHKGPSFLPGTAESYMLLTHCKDSLRCLKSLDFNLVYIPVMRGHCHCSQQWDSIGLIPCCCPEVC